MKKKVFISFVLILVSILTFGQELNYKKFELGPTIGINLGAALPFPFKDIPKGAQGSPDLNTSVGVFSYYNINDKWAIGTGFELSKNSFSFKADVVSQKYISTSKITGKKTILYYTGPTSGSFDFNYWLFPVEARYRFSDLYTATFGIWASWVYFHSFDVVAIGGKTGTNPDPDKQDPVPRVEYNFDDDLSSFNAGLTGGVQRKIIKNLYLDLKMKLGLFSVFKSGFDSIEYELYPIELKLGVTYNLF